MLINIAGNRTIINIPTNAHVTSVIIFFIIVFMFILSLILLKNRKD